MDGFFVHQHGAGGVLLTGVVLGRSGQAARRNQDTVNKNGIPLLGKKGKGDADVIVVNPEVLCKGIRPGLKPCKQTKGKGSLYCGECRCVEEGCKEGRVPGSNRCEPHKLQEARRIAEEMKELRALPNGAVLSEDDLK